MCIPTEDLVIQWRLPAIFVYRLMLSTYGPGHMFYLLYFAMPGLYTCYPLQILRIVEGHTSTYRVIIIVVR